MTDDLMRRLDNLYSMLDEEGYYTKANTVELAKDSIKQLAANCETLTAERDALKAAQIDAIRAALEAAAKCCDDKADRCDAAIKWNGGTARHNQDCIAAAYAMRDRASAIRAVDPAAIAASMKGEK